MTGYYRQTTRSPTGRRRPVATLGGRLARAGRRIVVIGLAVALAGCAARLPNTAERCPAGYGAPTLVVELFFGRSIPALGQVTGKQWNAFVNQVVVPNLPNGFTVFNASGAWMSPAGHATIREPTKVLLASLPDASGALAPIKRIRNAYQMRFRQQRVGMNVAQACGDF